MKSMLAKLKDKNGQSTVEFALVSILLLILVFGIVEFGMAWYRADLLKGAANIAARTYAVTKSYPSALNAAQTIIPSLTSIATDTTIPNQVTVTVRESFQMAVPGLLSMVSITNITRTATYRLEP